MADYPDLDVVFDCADPDRVAQFWMAALPGYDFPHGPPDGYPTWDEWVNTNDIPEGQRNLARTLVDKAGKPTNDLLQSGVRGETWGTKNRSCLHLDPCLRNKLTMTRWSGW